MIRTYLVDEFKIHPCHTMKGIITSAPVPFDYGFLNNIQLKLTWHRSAEEQYISTLYWSVIPIKDTEATGILHPNEYQYYQSLRVEARRSSFLRGRYCAKQALQYFLPQKAIDLCIINGVFSQPLLLNNQKNIGISISHSNSAAIAIAFPEQYPMAVDIEEWNPSLVSILIRQWTPNEQELIDLTGHPYQSLFFWCAKEALAKVLKTGFTISLSILEIIQVKHNNYYQFIYFKNFSQYKAIVFTKDKYVIALLTPANSELDFSL